MRGCRLSQKDTTLSGYQRCAKAGDMTQQSKQNRERVSKDEQQRRRISLLKGRTKEQWQRRGREGNVERHGKKKSLNGFV